MKTGVWQGILIRPFAHSQIRLFSRESDSTFGTATNHENGDSFCVFRVVRGLFSEESDSPFWDDNDE